MIVAEVQVIEGVPFAKPRSRAIENSVSSLGARQNQRPLPIAHAQRIFGQKLAQFLRVVVDARPAVEIHR